MELPGTLKFACTACGECCRDDQIIRLNGRDLEKLRNYLGFSSDRELEEKAYIEYVLEEPGFRRPRIKFRKGAFRFCPFLQNTMDEENRFFGLCELHPTHKPLVCRLSPLARLVDDRTGQALEEWHFVPPVDGCPGCGRGDFNAAREIEVLREDLDAETRWMRDQIARAGKVAGDAQPG